ncbi:MAG: TerD family protein [Alphaproteobacteria bacterium]|nr:TerD family protein [Alphaproteobacteria bacterium]
MSNVPEAEKEVIAGDSLHMNKGEEVKLTEASAQLRKVKVCLGWKAPEESDGFTVDIDASAFLLNRERRVRNDTDFVFYNNLEIDGGSVRHGGDNRVGDADGDDEVIHIDLETVPFDVESIAFSVTIHSPEERQQNFGLVKDAYIRVVNEEDGKELAHFDLSEDASEDNAMVFGELVRDGVGWKFKALGDGTDGGLYKIAREFGVNVAPM